MNESASFASSEIEEEFIEIIEEYIIEEEVEEDEEDEEMDLSARDAPRRSQARRQSEQSIEYLEMTIAEDEFMSFDDLDAAEERQNQRTASAHRRTSDAVQSVEYPAADDGDATYSSDDGFDLALPQSSNYENMHMSAITCMDFQQSGMINFENSYIFEPVESDEEEELEAEHDQANPDLTAQQQQNLSLNPYRAAMDKVRGVPMGKRRSTGAGPLKRRSTGPGPKRLSVSGRPQSPTRQEVTEFLEYEAQKQSGRPAPKTRMAPGRSHSGGLPSRKAPPRTHSGMRRAVRRSLITTPIQEDEPHTPLEQNNRRGGKKTQLIQADGNIPKSASNQSQASDTSLTFPPRQETVEAPGILAVSTHSNQSEMSVLTPPPPPPSGRANPMATNTSAAPAVVDDDDDEEMAAAVPLGSIDRTTSGSSQISALTGPRASGQSRIRTEEGGEATAPLQKEDAATPLEWQFEVSAVTKRPPSRVRKEEGGESSSPVNEQSNDADAPLPADPLESSITRAKSGNSEKSPSLSPPPPPPPPKTEEDQQDDDDMPPPFESIDKTKSTFSQVSQLTPSGRPIRSNKMDVDEGNDDQMDIDNGRRRNNYSPAFPLESIAGTKSNESELSPITASGHPGGGSNKGDGDSRLDHTTSTHATRNQIPTKMISASSNSQSSELSPLTASGHPRTHHTSEMNKSNSKEFDLLSPMTEEPSQQNKRGRDQSSRTPTSSIGRNTRGRISKDGSGDTDKRLLHGIVEDDSSWSPEEGKIVEIQIPADLLNRSMDSFSTLDSESLAADSLMSSVRFEPTPQQVMHKRQSDVSPIAPRRPITSPNLSEMGGSSSRKTAASSQDQSRRAGRRRSLDLDSVTGDRSQNARWVDSADSINSGAVYNNSSGASRRNYMQRGLSMSSFTGSRRNLMNRQTSLSSFTNNSRRNLMARQSSLSSFANNTSRRNLMASHQSSKRSIMDESPSLPRRYLSVDPDNIMQDAQMSMSSIISQPNAGREIRSKIIQRDQSPMRPLRTLDKIASPGLKLADDDSASEASSAHETSPKDALPLGSLPKSMAVRERDVSPIRPRRTISIPVIQTDSFFGDDDDSDSWPPPKRSSPKDQVPPAIPEKDESQESPAIEVEEKKVSEMPSDELFTKDDADVAPKLEDKEELTQEAPTAFAAEEKQELEMPKAESTLALKEQEEEPASTSEEKKEQEKPTILLLTYSPPEDNVAPQPEKDEEEKEQDQPVVIILPDYVPPPPPLPPRGIPAEQVKARQSLRLESLAFDLQQDPELERLMDIDEDDDDDMPEREESSESESEEPVSSSESEEEEESESENDGLTLIAEVDEDDLSASMRSASLRAQKTIKIEMEALKKQQDEAISPRADPVKMEEPEDDESDEEPSLPVIIVPDYMPPLPPLPKRGIPAEEVSQRQTRRLESLDIDFDEPDEEQEREYALKIDEPETNRLSPLPTTKDNFKESPSPTEATANTEDSEYNLPLNIEQQEQSPAMALTTEPVSSAEDDDKEGANESPSSPIPPAPSSLRPRMSDTSISLAGVVDDVASPELVGLKKKNDSFLHSSSDTDSSFVSSASLKRNNARTTLAKLNSQMNSTFGVGMKSPVGILSPVSTATPDSRKSSLEEKRIEARAARERLRQRFSNARARVQSQLPM